MPIYFGTTEPQQLVLGAAERAAIGLVLPVSEDALCTGILLPGGWVLTARHCDTGVALRFETSGVTATSTAVTGIVHHPEHDVMLLEPDAGTPLAAAPIPLWGDRIDESWVGAPVTLAGVGQTETRSVGALRFAEERVVLVDETEIRVDGAGVSGACIGDSGGPLLVAAADGSARIAGVLDRGARSCVGVDVYTRVDRIHDWVTQITGARAPGTICDRR
jgi:secreted trypsin-like serine protease